MVEKSKWMIINKKLKNVLGFGIKHITQEKVAFFFYSD